MTKKNRVQQKKLEIYLNSKQKITSSNNFTTKSMFPIDFRIYNRVVYLLGVLVIFYEEVDKKNTKSKF